METPWVKLAELRKGEPGLSEDQLPSMLVTLMWCYGSSGTNEPSKHRTQLHSASTRAWKPGRTGRWL
ncbi:hypothetical protein P7K49_012413 [Saguinus oedipus]|uniref:Uncharacterized protein n=1 Tax=Saguinus oedipus TaxID=9490 RepID=A0ABQ9VTE2_SAGOE|nr:hypothetical protein P7K49_012413 [Saguinus oedipus]